MIEQVMVFGLGFLTAGLLALACLPAVWRRALRLTTRRLSQLVPLSMDEIVAERDGLRAGFAVEQRRLEQKLESVEARRSDLMVDLGRRDVRVAALGDAAVVAAAHITDLTRKLAETTRELHDVRGGTGAAAVALHDITGLAERRLWEVQAAEDSIRSLGATIDQNRVTIASLDMRILGLDDRMADLEQTLGHSRAELARTVQAVGRATAERDAALATAQSAATEREGLAAEVVRLRCLTEELHHRAASETQAAAAHKVTLTEMQGQCMALEARLAMQAEAGQAAAARLGEVEAEKTALLDRLTAIEASRSTEPPAPAGEDAELAVLREALRQVADDVLRMTERQSEVTTDPASEPVSIAELSLPN